MFRDIPERYVFNPTSEQTDSFDKMELLNFQISHQVLSQNIIDSFLSILLFSLGDRSIDSTLIYIVETGKNMFD